MDRTLDELLLETDIVSLQSAMESGSLTSEVCVRWYLDRITRIDPKLNSVIEVNPDAIEQAIALDAERREQGVRGPLHGIPILLKDNIDTGDHMHTSAGSVALAEHIAKSDSMVAAQLRAAGAIFLGKANMTEWANFMSTTMLSGYSSRGGQTLNPYGPGELFVGDQVRALQQPSPPICVLLPWAQKHRARLLVRPRKIALSALNQPSVWSVVQGLFRLRPAKIQPVR